MSQLKKAFFKLAVVKKRENAALMAKILKQKNLEKSLADGYTEMALINLSLAEMSLEADNDVFRQYEEKLTECE